MPPPLVKYPRTAHIAGSALQPGDDASANAPLEALAGHPVVIEEKLDGANAALSFDAAGALWLQSRGHYLTGGGRERHFALFKAWAQAHAAAFRPRLEDRYVVYGEWLFAKHTIFYDALPHYFMEFDVYDRREDRFLSTPARRALLAGLPIQPVPVLYEGPAPTRAALERLVAPSVYKSSAWRAALMEAVIRQGLDPDVTARQTDPRDQAEGLYLKVETEAVVIERFKWVRASFLQSVEDGDGHWLTRPIVPNALALGADLMAARLGGPAAYDR